MTVQYSRVILPCPSPPDERLRLADEQYVHRAVEELSNPAVLSKSATTKGRRRLSVMRRIMMEGLAFTSGDAVIVVDAPAPPTFPADVGDLGKRERQGGGGRGEGEWWVCVCCSRRLIGDPREYRKRS